MESQQLKNIQNIQNSLQLLKFKIDKMAQLDSQKQDTINSLILSTIPVVDRKLKEEAKELEIYEKKSRFVDTSKLKQKNLESRIVNEKQVARSKELVAVIKQHNSMHLKQSTRKNEEKIRKIKQLNLESKKEKMLRVREREQQAQRKIQHFHEQKTQELRMQRQQENKENKLRIDNLMQQLTFLERREGELEQKLKSADHHISKFRTVIKKVDKMKCTQFSKFRNELSNVERAKKSNPRCLSEAILLQTASK